MEMKVAVTILGVKSGVGDFEGKPYDFCRIYIEEPFSKDSETARGSAVIEHTWGKSANFQKLKDLNYPLRAEIELEMSSNGKGGQITKCLNVRPVDSRVPASPSKP